MRTKALAMLVALGLAVAAYVVFFRASDEEQIRAAVTRLAAAVDIHDDGGNALLRAARVRDDLEKILTDDVHVSAPELSSGPVRRGRDGVLDVAAQAQLGFSEAHVDLRAIEIKIDDARKSAQVGAHASLKGTTRGGDTRRDDRAVDFLLRKEDGAWKIAVVTVWPPQP